LKDQTAGQQARAHGLILKACIRAAGLAGIVAAYVAAPLARYLPGDTVFQRPLG
jgi:predicted membrane-bound spermidine synthase